MRTSRDSIHGLALATVCVCLLTGKAWAFDAIEVVASSGSVVPGLPAGQTAVFESFAAPRLGVNGHLSYRGVAAGTDQWSGIYLFDAHGTFVNRLLDRDRSVSGTSAPVTVTISATGSATVVRRAFSQPTFGLRLDQDGGSVEYAPAGSTIANIGPRTIIGLFVNTGDPHRLLMPTLGGDVIARVSFDPRVIGAEILNGAIVRISPDGQQTPLIFDGNVPDGRVQLSWPLDVARSGSFLYLASDSGVPQSTALRLRTSEGAEEVLARISGPHPVFPERFARSITSARLNENGDVLAAISDGTDGLASYAWSLRRDGDWTLFPRRWTLPLPTGIVDCICFDSWNFMEDASVFADVDCFLPGEISGTRGSLHVAPDGRVTVLTAHDLGVRTRSGFLATYIGGPNMPAPTSARHVHVAPIRMPGRSSANAVVAIDSDGDIVALAAVGDTFVWQGLTWRITIVQDVAHEGADVIFTAVATATGGLNRNFVLRTTIAGSNCGDIDFNNDGVWPSESDIIDFFNVFAGTPCPTLRCDTIDFNRNGVFPEDQDALDFFLVLAGGSCNP
jgi:hypothetical protein